MGRKHQAAKIVYNFKDQIIDLHQKRYTLLEIYETIPELKANMSYSTLARNCSNLQLLSKKSKDAKIDKTESTKNENFVNENHVTEKDDKLSENAKRNLEKLTNRKPKFSYDHSTKGKDFY